MTAEDQIAMNQTHNAYGFRARFYSHAIRLEEEKIQTTSFNQVGTGFPNTYLGTGS